MMRPVRFERSGKWTISCRFDAEHYVRVLAARYGRGLNV